jgi:hypothetical protein
MSDEQKQLSGLTEELTAEEKEALQKLTDALPADGNLTPEALEGIDLCVIFCPLRPYLKSAVGKIENPLIKGALNFLIAQAEKCCQCDKEKPSP